MVQPRLGEPGVGGVMAVYGAVDAVVSMQTHILWVSNNYYFLLFVH